MRSRVSLLVVSMALVSVPASASDLALTTGYVPLPPSMGEVAPGPPTTNILFLNRCASGCVVTPGFDDSRQNRSSILDSVAQFDAYPHGDDSWNRMVACVDALYAPFDIIVTDQDPGNVPHFEAIVAGKPEDAGFPHNVGGVAPFACGVIENSITFTFAESLGNQSLRTCEVVAQETAHGFGLDHEVLCEDPLTYLSGCGRKCFQNQDAACGEYGARECYCGGDMQNSWQYLADTFGMNPSPPQPEMSFIEPQPGGTVSVGFHVRVDSSLTCLDQVEAWVVQGDTAYSIGTLTTWPYVFNTPQDLQLGSATVRVRASDHNGDSVQSEIDVTVGVGPAEADASVPPCQQGQCADAGIPSGASEPGGIGCDATGRSAAPMFLVLLALSVAITARRRRVS